MNSSRMTSRVDKSFTSSVAGGFRHGKTGDDKNVMEWQYIPKDVNILQMGCTIGNWFCLSTFGELFSWGQKTESLGRKQTSLEDVRNPTRIQLSHKVVSFATGKNHVLALSERGEIFSWGKNDFGQLGHGNRVSEALPKPIQALQKEEIVQVYCGDECSFAVSKRGLVYAWGKNLNKQVGDTENDIEDLPNPLVQCPWDIMQTRIIYGRDNASYIYNVQLNLFNEKLMGSAPGSTLKSQFIQDSNIQGQMNMQQLYPQGQITKKKDYQIAELQRVIEDLKEKLKQKGHVFGDEHEDQFQEQKNYDKNDMVLKEITQNINDLNRERMDLENKIRTSKNEIDNIEKEVQESKKYEETLIKKGDEFMLKKKNIEMQIREIQKEKDRTIEQSTKLADLNRNLIATKEIIESNDDLKNKAIMKQNQSEELKNKAKSLGGDLERRKEEVSKKERMFNQIKEERRKYLKLASLEDKKIDLEKWIIIIHSQLKQLRETGIQEICNKQFRDAKEDKQKQFELTHTGIEEIAKQSHLNVDKISKSLKEVKLNPNDPSADIIAKVVEILEDDIQCRKQINDLTLGLLIQTSNKNQLFQQRMMKLEQLEDNSPQQISPMQFTDNGDEEEQIREAILQKYQNLNEHQQDEYQQLKKYVRLQKQGRDVSSPALLVQERQKEGKEENQKKKTGVGLFFF